MKISKKDVVRASLYFGGLWGTCEATLGYMFHYISRVTMISGISGFFMFPIGFYFMRLAFRETSRLESIFYTASVAASIKLLDIFLPFLTPLDTINPAIAILLEALAVLAFFKIFSPEEGQFALWQGVTVSMSWRIAFVLFLLLPFTPTGIVAKGTEETIKFIFLHGLVNGLLIALILRFGKKPAENVLVKLFRVYPGLTYVVLVVAVITGVCFK